MLSDGEIAQAAAALIDSRRMGKPISPVTTTWPGLTIEQAYTIQQCIVDNAIREGRRVVGKKIGVTSEAVMTMLGVRQPDFGVLLDDMMVPNGGAAKTSALIQPRIEGEIGFVLRRDLSGPGVTAAEVLASTEGVLACLEIVDSRIANWQIRIEDTVADNASCGLCVLGDRLVQLDALDLYTCGMVLERNGVIVGVGAGAATMGGPVNAIVWLANTLGRLAMGLRAGEVVLSGALSAMVPCIPGNHFRVAIGGIGSCSVRFE